MFYLPKPFHILKKSLLQGLGQRETVLSWVRLILAFLALAGLSLHLYGRYFHRELDSDFLYPHMFVKDWLFGPHPIDAWKFGSATFIFPDYPIHMLLILVFGDSGAMLVAFGVINMLLLGVASGFAFTRIGGANGTGAFAAGFVVVALVLMLQFLPHHGQQMHLLMRPGFHGSSLVLGITLSAVLAGAYGERRLLSSKEKLAVLLLGGAGFFSNTLLFTQFLAPWLVVLAICVWLGGRGERSLFAQQAMLIGVILGGVILIRLGLEWANFWEHARVFRHAPYPDKIWVCFLDFLSDLSGETGARLWAFWALLLVLVLVGMIGAFWPRDHDWLAIPRVYCVYAILSVASGVSLPILALYWDSIAQGRYFLNLLILPALALGLWVSSQKRFFPLGGERFSVVFLALLATFSVSLIGRDLSSKSERFRFPYSARVAEFDEMVERHQLSLGLCQYWRSHLYNQLGKSQVFMNHIEKDGSPYFWCNNAYWYYGLEKPDEGTPLVFPDYDFVLTNGLNRKAIRKKFGDPEKVVKGKYNEIYIYRNRSSQIRSSLAPPVAEWLRGKKLRVSEGNGE